MIRKPLSCPYCGAVKGHHRVCKEMRVLERIDLTLKDTSSFTVAKVLLDAITKRSKRP